MANLLYYGYKGGAYISSGLDYYYCNNQNGSDVCYFADLSPSTTYTIRLLDARQRFVIGTFYEDVKMLIGSASWKSNTKHSHVWRYVDAPAGKTLTFTTGSTDIYIVVYVTRENNLYPRVMLNEGSTAEEYEEPTVPLPYWWETNEEGLPTHSYFPATPSSPMEEPWPYALWRIDPLINDGYPYHELMPDLVRKGPGAFKNAAHLTRVRIPETVKIIGKEAFRYTALRSVTIAPDCTYSETSFPEGCEVSYYGGGGEYGQLVDCNGVEILDCEAVRVYVKGE